MTENQNDMDYNLVERLLKTVKELETENARLRKILVRVPTRVALKAVKEAGVGNVDRKQNHGRRT